MSEKRVRHPNLAARAEPMCTEPLRLSGVTLACDRPRGHLPPNEHASTIHWQAPVVRVVESHKPPRQNTEVIKEKARRYRVEDLPDATITAMADDYGSLGSHDFDVKYGYNWPEKYGRELTAEFERRRGDQPLNCCGSTSGHLPACEVLVP